MEPRILDRNLNWVGILDDYESLLWVERYNSYGDFEIYTSASIEHIDQLKEGYYLSLIGSNQTMIIEDIEISSDIEAGDRLIITGRSLESILDRRIVWTQTILDGYLQGQIEKLLNQNIINPTDSSRKIDEFVFAESTDEWITSLKVSTQFTGDNLYDAISGICIEKGLGFRISLTDNKNFEFKLYKGVDRSYGQTKNPYVVFSPGFDNLINSNYLFSKKTLKTVTLVAGEEEGSNRRTTTVFASDASGLDRRELYTDARDISSQVDDRTLTEEEYAAQLVQRGNEKLSENTKIETFEGQAESRNMFIYGKDYFIGDIVQTANIYGIEFRSRITEVIRSQNSKGVDLYPTFEIVEQE